MNRSVDFMTLLKSQWAKGVYVLMNLDLIRTVGGYFILFKFINLMCLHTVSNLMDNAWEVHSFPVELSNHGNSTNVWTISEPVR